MRTFLATTAVGLLVLVSPVRAESDETVIWMGLQQMSWNAADVTPNETPLGLGATAGVRYGLDDFWEIAVQLGGGATVSEGARDKGFGGVALEARYTIDALTWVPWITGGAGGFARLGGDEVDPRLDMTVHLGVGLDYRPRRTWGLSASVRAHRTLTDADVTAGPIETTLAYAWYLD